MAKRCWRVGYHGKVGLLSRQTFDSRWAWLKATEFSSSLMTVATCT